MAADVTSSLSCSTLRSQEDPFPTNRPAIRSLKTSRRDEICDGFDSLSGLLSDLRSAQDDAQQEVSRALDERDRLLCCLQSKEENDGRLQDFLSQLTNAESRCSDLHEQLDQMRQMYARPERTRRQKPCRGRRRTPCNEASRAPPSPDGCPGTVADRVQQYIVQRRRSLSCSTHPGASRSPRRPCGNASSPSLRGAGAGRCKSRSPAPRNRQTKPCVRLRAESLMSKMGGRRDCGDEMDKDGGQLWGSKGRCVGAILANASKYEPDGGRPPLARGRARSQAACGAPRPGCPRRRAASESVSRRCAGRDSGIDSESESPCRRGQRAPRGRQAAKKVGRAKLPFLSSSTTSQSHHIGANIQHVMSLSRQAGCAVRAHAPLPEVKVSRLPHRGPFVRYHRRKPFKYRDATEIDKYKIYLKPRSCGPDNTADYASYQREGENGDQKENAARSSAYRSKSCTEEDSRSAASAHAQRMLCSPAALRNTRQSLKLLLEDLAEEFAGLECVCQQLETDMDAATGARDRCKLEEQIGRLEQMMEERRRQVCCLLKLYKQIKKLSRGMGGGGGGGGGDGGRPARLRGGRGLTCRKPLRVNTRIQPSSVRPRGVSFSMQKSFPMRPLVPRQPSEPARCRKAFANSDPRHSTQVKVLRDMRNIQRHMRAELGEEY